MNYVLVAIQAIYPPCIQSVISTRKLLDRMIDYREQDCLLVLGSGENCYSVVFNLPNGPKVRTDLL